MSAKRINDTTTLVLLCEYSFHTLCHPTIHAAGIAMSSHSFTNLNFRTFFGGCGFPSKQLPANNLQVNELFIYSKPSAPRRHFHVLQWQHHGRHHLQQKPEAICKMRDTNNTHNTTIEKHGKSTKNTADLGSNKKTSQTSNHHAIFFFTKSVHKSNFGSLSASPG